METFPSAPEILAEVADLATLTRSSFHNELAFQNGVRYKFVTTYNHLLPAVGRDSVTADDLRALASDTYLQDNFDGILKAVASVRVPGTDIPMFLQGEEAGGSYSLFDLDGNLTDFVEKRSGICYGTPENPQNAAPFTVTKPLAFYLFRALNRPLDISDQENSDLVCKLLNKEPGSFHMGGINVGLPDLSGAGFRRMFMGISSVELTPEALRFLIDTFIARGAETSIDGYKPGLSREELYQVGHYTAAGFLDELAGNVAAAYLNNRHPGRFQAIADAQWNYRLMNAAINPGPLPGQYC